MAQRTGVLVGSSTPLPLNEAMGLARASRMDGAEYSMLREQFTLLVEDKIASVRITPPPAVSYQKARHHCLKVAKNLEVAITVRRAPGGHIVCWKATAQEIETREKRSAALKSRRARRLQRRERLRVVGNARAQRLKQRSLDVYASIAYAHSIDGFPSRSVRPQLSMSEPMVGGFYLAC